MNLSDMKLPKECEEANFSICTKNEPSLKWKPEKRITLSRRGRKTLVFPNSTLANIQFRRSLHAKFRIQFQHADLHYACTCKSVNFWDFKKENQIFYDSTCIPSIHVLSFPFETKNVFRKVLRYDCKLQSSLQYNHASLGLYHCYESINIVNFITITWHKRFHACLPHRFCVIQIRHKYLIQFFNTSYYITTISIL